MAKVEVRSLIGPTGDGVGYGTVVDAFVSDEGMKETILASAYLTVEGAQQVLASIYGLSLKKKKPKVTILVGTKDRFTRRAAIRELLAHSVGRPKAAKCPVALEVLCPNDSNFHVKAAFVQIGSQTWAAIGSHNLTGAGLDSASELGVLIKGSTCKEVRTALTRWVNDSRNWATVLSKYKERALPPSSGGVAGQGSGGKDENVSNVAADFEADRPVTDAESRAIDDAYELLEATAPVLASRAHKYLILDQTRQEAVDDSSYYRGSLFSYSDDYPGGSWRVGQKRAVMRVLDVVQPNRRNKKSVLFAQQVKSFKVDPEVRQVANQLKIIKEWPTPIAMARFLTYLRTGVKPSK